MASATIRVEFPFGIEMDDFQWGYMIHQRMVNHQPKQLVFLPRCHHLRNIRVDGGGGGGEIGGGVVSSQDAMGGWDHERSRDDDS